MLASLPHLSRHQSTTLTPPLSSSCFSHRRARQKISNPCNHRNQQYSIIGLTNAAGTLVERYSYTAYGTLGIYDASGTVRTTSTYANRYTYTGREYDADLNLYHFRARWYDPATILNWDPELVPPIYLTIHLSDRFTVGASRNFQSPTGDIAVRVNGVPQPAAVR